MWRVVWLGPGSEGVPNIKKVVGLQRIREWYNTPTLKNHLAKSFPLFIADDTIYKKLMKAIGMGHGISLA